MFFCCWQIKTFGSLIRGLRVGIDLLLILQREDHGILSLPKFASVPTLNELDDLLNQFEAAMEDDFPNYQVTTTDVPIIHHCFE